MPGNTSLAPRRAGRIGWQDWMRRLLLFAVFWWVLSGGDAHGWLLGAPFIVIASWLSLQLWADAQLSITGVLRFLPWFAYQSLVGAVDVAQRALRPGMPLKPGLVRHRVRLPAGLCRVSLANVISMLAGTLSADLVDDELVIHTLDTGRDMHAMVRDLEPRIAALFSLDLDAGSGAPGAS